MTWLWRNLRKLRIRPIWLTAAILAGVMLHLGTVLTATHFGPNRGVVALTKLGTVNQMTVLAPVTGGHQPVAFASPSERYAICPFDLRKGPVTVKAQLADDDWLVAIYSPEGANVFSVRAADLARRNFELILATKDDAAGLAFPLVSSDSVATTLGLDDRTGIAVIEAPAARAAAASQTQRLLAQASCTQKAKSSSR